MSISNLLVPNDLNLFCNTINAKSSGLITSIVNAPDVFNVVIANASTSSSKIVNGIAGNSAQGIILNPAPFNGGNITINSEYTNQDVTNTGTPSFNGIALPESNVVTPLYWHSETAITGSFGGIWSSGQAGIIKLSRTNSIVTISQTAFINATQSTGASMTFNNPIPVDYRPGNLAALIKIPVFVNDNSVTLPGLLQFDPNNGNISILKYNFSTGLFGSFSGTGFGGVYPFTLSYDISI